MNITKTLCCLLLMSINCSVFAEEKASLSWSGSIEAEREYDSSVSLEQIDKVSRDSDYASQLKWSAAGKWQATKSVKFDANYQGTHRVYDHASEFDLDQHHFALSSKYTYAGMGYSYRYDHARAKVDGERFLKFAQSTLAIDKLFQSRYFLRAAVSSNTKDFSQLSDRNAKAHIVGLDSLIFFNQGNSHLGVSVSVEEEKAQASLYDNKAQNLRLSYEYKFTEIALPTTFISSVQYSHKRYDSFAVDTENDGGIPLITSNSSDMRVDKRVQLSVGLELAINAWLELVLKADYINNASNYAPVDISEHLVSVGIKSSF